MVFTPARESSQTPSFVELLEASYEKRSLVHLPAGSRVPLLKKSVWLVVRGMVKLSAISVQGDDLLLGLAGPNEPFGDPLSNVEVYEATTLCESDLLCLTCDEIAASPHLAMALLQGMGVRYRQSEAMLGLLGLRRIENRVRGFLELLANDYGQPCDQGLRLNIKLTHQELASALSTTRVTVTRVLGSLKDEGWLQLDGQRRLVIAHLPRRAR
jgi:CRP-like cAMP-binding protein